jgi:hypothetical protein
VAVLSARLLHLDHKHRSGGWDVVVVAVAAATATAAATAATIEESNRSGAVETNGIEHTLSRRVLRRRRRRRRTRRGEKNKQKRSNERMTMVTTDQRRRKKTARTATAKTKQNKGDYPTTTAP